MVTWGTRILYDATVPDPGPSPLIALREKRKAKGDWTVKDDERYADEYGIYPEED